MKTLFNNKALIGMIHTPELLSSQNHISIEHTISKCLQDLTVLQDAGFDAVLIENNDDNPQPEFASPAQIANLTAIAIEVVKHSKIPVGVQMMLNDWKSSFAICKAAGAQFTRLDVFVDDVTCKRGKITPSPKEIIAYKNKIYPELFLYTDIQVKHKEMIDKNKDLITSAQQAISNGSNGLVITGNWTGEETPIKNIKRVKSEYPEIPVLVGSGICTENLKEQLDAADYLIVGTSIKSGDHIDTKKAQQLTELKRILLG